MVDKALFLITFVSLIVAIWAVWTLWRADAENRVLRYWVKNSISKDRVAAAIEGSRIPDPEASLKRKDRLNAYWTGALDAVAWELRDVFGEY